MSAKDDTEVGAGYKIQASPTIGGEMWNLRANSGTEFRELVEGLAVELDGILTALNDVKQGVIAKGILTSPGKGSQTSTAPSKSDGPPTCKHGPMKDLRSKNYKSDFYCPEPDRDSQCKPVKL